MSLKVYISSYGKILKAVMVRNTNDIFRTLLIPYFQTKINLNAESVFH